MNKYVNSVIIRDRLTYKNDIGIFNSIIQATAILQATIRFKHEVTYLFTILF